MAGRITYPGYLPVFGTGAPGAGVPTFAQYFDTSTVPYTPYIYSAGAWHTVGGTGGGLNATMLQGIAVDPTAPTGGQVLKYNGTKWAPASATTAPTIVQVATYVGGAGLSATFGVAPTAGNLLVCMEGSSGAAVNATGWNQLFLRNSSWVGLGYKIAGASESTTQTPFTSNAAAFAIFEIANGGIGMYYGLESLAQSTAYPMNWVRTFHPGQLIIGTVTGEGTSVPTSISNATYTNVVGTKSMCYWSQTLSTAGVCSAIANWSANTWNDVVQMVIV